VLHHMEFKGLPSPAAAAAVASMVLLFDYLQTVPGGWKSAAWLKTVAGATLPAVTVAVALLMISRFRYPHLLNRLIRPRRSLWVIVAALSGIVLSLVFLQLAVALGALIYALLGPAGAAGARLRGRRPQPETEEEDDDEPDAPEDFDELDEAD